MVGLTGGIGSGKSTVARMFADLGVHWVDADDVAREVVEPGTPALAAIAEHFGAAILQADGALDRAALRRIVFDAPDERAWLESLLHPVIRDELVRQLRHPEERIPGYALPYVMLVSPLLLETDQHRLVSEVLVVDVPEAVQVERTMARDQNDRAQVERIMAAQMPRQTRRERATTIIDNNRPAAQVAQQVRTLHEALVNHYA
ncbi:dephospho-CoA kinase [Marinobacter sp. C2H3]|uniref:dephospho-CoA kinase n=1 Tax=Marinobacter sp. C2H3 TaxID=3119003 RepID=UPI00300F1210